MIRAFLFDMGGTLLHYPQPGDGSWRALEQPGMRGVYHYLREQGHLADAHEEVFIDTMFQRLGEGWEQAVGGGENLRAEQWIAQAVAGHTTSLNEAVLRSAVEQYARPLRAGVVPAPGAAATLAALRERGLRLGLVSNTIWPGAFHRADLEQAGLLHYLDASVFSGDFGVWKPQPGIFQHMLARLGVPARHAVFVGDSPREDIAGALALGMRAVWVRNREFPLDAQPADAEIGSLPELLPLLDTWE